MTEGHLVSQRAGMGGRVLGAIQLILLQAYFQQNMNFNSLIFMDMRLP
jgi:hypothetical protein